MSIINFTFLGNFRENFFRIVTFSFSFQKKIITKSRHIPFVKGDAYALHSVIFFEVGQNNRMVQSTVFRMSKFEDYLRQYLYFRGSLTFSSLTQFSFLALKSSSFILYLLNCFFLQINQSNYQNFNWELTLLQFFILSSYKSLTLKLWISKLYLSTFKYLSDSEIPHTQKKKKKLYRKYRNPSIYKHI